MIILPRAVYLLRSPLASCLPPPGHRTASSARESCSCRSSRPHAPLPPRLQDRNMTLYNATYESNFEQPTEHHVFPKLQVPPEGVAGGHRDEDPGEETAAPAARVGRGGAAGTARQALEEISSVGLARWRRLHGPQLTGVKPEVAVANCLFRQEIHRRHR